MVGAVELDSTVTGGTTTTLIDTGNLAGYGDDTFNNQRVYVYSGTALGQERRIVDFTDSTDTITFGTGTAPVAGDKYIILKPGWQIDQLRVAILTAMRRRRKFYMLPKVDESLTLAVTAGVPTYEYTVPTGFASIQRITRENNASGADYWTPIPDETWFINRGATKQITFEKVANDHWGFISDGLKLHIEGQQYETEPTADSSSLTIPTGALLLLAASIALQGARTRDIQNTSGFAGLASTYYQQWLVARGDDETEIYPGSKVVGE